MFCAVTLFSSDNESTFIAFTITALEGLKENPKNIRRPISLKAGHIIPSHDSRIDPLCSNTVVQSNIMPKTSVNVSVNVFSDIEIRNSNFTESILYIGDLDCSPKR